MFVKDLGQAALSVSLASWRSRLATWFKKFEQEHEDELAARRMRRDLRRIASLSPHLLSDAGFAEDQAGSGVWRSVDCACTVETCSDTPSPAPLSGRG